VDEVSEVEVNEMMPPHATLTIGYRNSHVEQQERDAARRKSIKKKNANAAGLLLKGLGSIFFSASTANPHQTASPESGHQSSGSVPTVSGHHSMAGGHMIMPSSGNQFHAPSPPERADDIFFRSFRKHWQAVCRERSGCCHHVLRRTVPPDERDRAELGRQMASLTTSEEFNKRNRILSQKNSQKRISEIHLLDQLFLPSSED
jgi:hypothetical protein